MNTTPENQRSDHRFQAVLPAIVHIGGQPCPCSAEDLSRHGVLLVGPLPLPDEPELRVVVRTAAGDLELELTGRVAHVKPTGEEEEIRIGLQFESMSDEDVERLERLVSRVIQGVAPAALTTLPSGASPAEIRQALSKIPIPHRVNLAVRAKSGERAQLRHDTTPQVLEGLARNPNITLPEIKVLLRSTNLLPSTLEIIATDPRWRRDEESRLMIATHPRVTFQTADKIVAQLPALAVQRLVQKPGLQPGVKQKLMARFAKKHRGAP